jgi:RimJ/RimL family protein N-acetyltransferase
MSIKAMPVELDAALDRLRQAPLRNVVLLKLLSGAGGTTPVFQAASGQDLATLALIDHRFSSFDRQAYPTARASAVIASDRPDLTQALIACVPCGETLVFKLESEADRRVVAAAFPLERRMAFHSYTASGPVAAEDGIHIGCGQEAPFELFAAQGHDAGWLAPLLREGLAFTSVIARDGQALSACLAFRIDSAVWEVGGVYTRPAHRGRGLAARVVRGALAELARRRLAPRYQVADDNLASIHLAEALGMNRFLTITHYLSLAGTA